MSAQDQKKFLMENLALLVESYLTDAGAVIEFGDPKNAATGLQLCYMLTAGGLQYRLTHINSRQQTFASEYTPDPEKIVEMAMAAAEKLSCSRPFHPRGARPSAPDMSWYLANPGAPSGFNLSEEDLDREFPGSVVITL